MRVIAGSFKGRRMKTPYMGGPSTNIRQAARNPLQHPRAARRGRACPRRDSAGTGARRHRGAEPRRGARHVHRERPAGGGVDRGEPEAPAAWRKAILLQCADVVAALNGSPAADAFDLILLDPPHRHRQRNRRTRRGGGPMLLATACVVLERATRREPDEPAALRPGARREVWRQHADDICDSRLAIRD